MQIHSSTDKDEIKKWSIECLEKKLYVRGRLAYDWFKLPEQIPKMSVLKKEEGNIAGWCFSFMRTFDPVPFMGVFLSKDYRKLGWSKKLIGEFVRNYNGPFEVSNQYRKFFDKIKCLERKLI